MCVEDPTEDLDYVSKNVLVRLGYHFFFFAMCPRDLGSVPAIEVSTYYVKA